MIQFPLSCIHITQSTCWAAATGRKDDEKHMWLSSEGETAGGMATNIAVCNLVVACLETCGSKGML